MYRRSEFRVYRRCTDPKELSVGLRPATQLFSFLCGHFRARRTVLENRTLHAGMFLEQLSHAVGHVGGHLPGEAGQTTNETTPPEQKVEKIVQPAARPQVPHGTDGPCQDELAISARFGWFMKKNKKKTFKLPNKQSKF